MRDLPSAIAEACAPLFAAVPLDQAMSRLIGSFPCQIGLVESVLGDPVLAGRPELAAALWLYADDLDRSHAVSQQIETPTGAYWHGIMHRREGDFQNSLYWMRRAVSHPFRATRPDLDPTALIDAVARAGGQDLPELVARQRAEWQALFAWCAAHS